MTGSADGCAICEKHEGRDRLLGEPIFEGPHVLAFHAPLELVSGYLRYVFVETRRHVRGLAERTDEEAHAEALLVSRLARALEEAGAEHVYAFVFDHVPHHHVHVVARHPGTPKEYWGCGWTSGGAPRAAAPATSPTSARACGSRSIG